MKSNRRDFLITAGLVSTGSLIPNLVLSSEKTIRSSLNLSNKIKLGVITYSYRSLPGNLYSTIGYCLESGINSIELMSNPVEKFLGIPKTRKLQRSWRENISLDNFKKLRKLFDEAGISIYAYKPHSIGINNTNKEIEKSIHAASILGAKSVTVEILDGIIYKIQDKKKYNEYTQKLGDIGEKYNVYIGYHNHTQGTDTLWENVLSQSAYNSINLDIGHYIARGRGNTDKTLLKFIKNNHARITSMHIKDRQNDINGGHNKPFGKGDTPILEVVELIDKKEYDIPLSIELEYSIPKRSNAVKEVKKCLDYCKSAIKT
ncbi:MAG: sugar phosphate isomerase/epimerase [Flavobacteriaceae bacterium]|nr:sugar phosphate isomerase/epimerase [Flavobacteriaceae bacterium]